MPAKYRNHEATKFGDLTSVKAMQSRVSTLQIARCRR